MNKKKLGGIIGGILGLCAIALLAFSVDVRVKVNETFGLADYKFTNNASDVIGSKTATTTVGQDFSVNALSVGQSATTTAVKKIGSNVSEAIFTIMPLKVSSTANLRWEFQGSQDYGCETTATSTTDTSQGDVPLISEINWFGIGQHIKGDTQDITFLNTSSTNFMYWSNPMANTGQTVVLEDLNYECIRLNISGSSTEAWIQLATK